MDEIRHEVEIGVQEWNRYRGLDTMIREHCLKGAEQHFDTAFFLLSDIFVHPEAGSNQKRWDYAQMYKNITSIFNVRSDIFKDKTFDICEETIEDKKKTQK